MRRAVHRRAFALALAGVATLAVAAPATPATMTCTGSSVGVCSCPQLDPARYQLVSIQASLSGATTIQVLATAPTVGERTVAANGLQTLDLGGRAFYWPATGSGTVLVGPSNGTYAIDLAGSADIAWTDDAGLAKFRGTSSVKMISSYDPKTVSMPGGTASFAGTTKARTSFGIVYTYVPLARAVVVTSKTPTVPKHPTPTGPLTVDPRLRIQLGASAPASGPSAPAKPSGLLPATVACTP